MERGVDLGWRRDLSKSIKMGKLKTLPGAMSRVGWETNWGWVKEETGFELCSAVSIEFLNFLAMGKKHYES